RWDHCGAWRRGPRLLRVSHPTYSTLVYKETLQRHYPVLCYRFRVGRSGSVAYRDAVREPDSTARWQSQECATRELAPSGLGRLRIPLVLGCPRRENGRASTADSRSGSCRCCAASSPGGPSAV